MSNPPTYQVTPEKFIYGGETLARLPDGRAVFIPFTLPGERVEIQLTEDKERYARGEVLQIITPNQNRIQPKCVHFEECGGCHYQHLPYLDQLQVKRAVLQEQLERIGKFTDPPVQDMVPSPQPFYYRNYVQFQISREGELGFYRAQEDSVLPIQECHLPEELLNEAWPILDLDVIPGLNRVGMRTGEGDQDLLLILESEDPAPVEFSVDLPLSAVHLGPGGELILSGDEFTIVGVHGFPFVVSARSFFQVNTGVAELLIDHLRNVLPLSSTTTLFDVYCGVGLFSVFLASAVEKVIGVESAPTAVEDFMHNLQDFENVEIYEGRAEDILPLLEEQPDIILVDPPRGGLDRKVLDEILEHNPAILAYVSCDPATLARDARRLVNGGYTLTQTTPFDMFPQTYHIESVSLFER
jgi:23S rRNA (uracil1939-C5)-methyltransferase